MFFHFLLPASLPLPITLPAGPIVGGPSSQHVIVKNKLLISEKIHYGTMDQNKVLQITHKDDL